MARLGPQAWEVSQSCSGMEGQGCSHFQSLLEKDLVPALHTWLLAGSRASLAVGQRHQFLLTKGNHQWWLASLGWESDRGHPRQKLQSFLWSQKWHSFTSTVCCSLETTQEIQATLKGEGLHRGRKKKKKREITRSNLRGYLPQRTWQSGTDKVASWGMGGRQIMKDLLHQAQESGMYGIDRRTSNTVIPW